MPIFQCICHEKKNQSFPTKRFTRFRSMFYFLLATTNNSNNYYPQKHTTLLILLPITHLVYEIFREKRKRKLARDQMNL